MSRTFERDTVDRFYPAGTTHAEARVQRIKTGAARIALGYETEHPGELTMIPVGLSFEARKSFRGRVLVAFGEPIQPGSYLKAWREDPVKAVDALTQDLQSAMETQVVNVERIDDQHLVHAVEELYRDELAAQVMDTRGLARRDVDTVRLSRSIADAVRHFKASDPVRIETLWQRIQAYRALLRPPHGAQGDGLRDDPAAGHHRGPAALLGAGDVAGVARSRRAVGRRLRVVAADFRHDRVSLPDRRRLAARAPALRGARRDAERGRAAAGDRARGDRGRARARQAGLSHRHEGEQLLSVHRLEEMSTVALDALDRARTVIVLTVSPLEEHGPHLPLGVDAFAARHFAETIG